MANRGRPSLYTEELAQEVLDRLSSGETLASICRSDHIPNVQTIYLWKNTHEQFNIDFAHAREIGFDEIANDCLAIADNGINDTYETENGEKTNVDVIARSKLRVETRLKLLAKWDYKRYGDKLTTENTTKLTMDLTDEELDKKLDDLG